MTDRKFFSGLTDGMMTRNKSGPNRQQTNFYWPNETETEDFVPTRNRMRNRSLSTASLKSQSQASTDTEESRRQRSQQSKSKIEFYDTVDVGSDTESIYSQADTRRQKKQETLKSRIEFYDFVDTRNSQPDDDAQSVIERPLVRNLAPSVDHDIPVTLENRQNNNEKSKAQVKNQNEIQQIDENLSQSIQKLDLSPEPKNRFTPSYAPPEKPRRKAPPSYADSFSESDDEERFHRSSNLMVDDRRYLTPQQHRYTPSQRSVRSHPRRQNFEYFDYDDDEYDRHYESARRPRYRKPEIIPRVRRRDFSQEISDEEFYDNVDGYRRDYRVRERPPPDDRYRSNASRFDDTESYYRGRNNRRPTSVDGSEVDFHRESRRTSPQNVNTNSNQSPSDNHSNGFENEVEQQRMPASARPPVKPLTRTMSINEAKQRQQVNLKSNIFHTDPDYNQIVEQRKPLSVRDFAARQRVGVGLPDI